jgi:hypothetical protein
VNISTCLSYLTYCFLGLSFFVNDFVLFTGEFCLLLAINSSFSVVFKGEEISKSFYIGIGSAYYTILGLLVI